MAQVIEANRDVQDPYDVAAVVESCGWTDRRVENTFGFANVFELAEEMYQDIKVAVVMEPVAPRLTLPWSVILSKMAREFGHGLTFTLPMMVSVMSMITLHISFASYQYSPVEQATAIALATFFSFITTGGYTQAMANIYYILLGMQEVSQVESTIFLVMRWGFWTSVGLAGLLIMLDLVFPIMPIALMQDTAVYVILLSVVWLSFAGLYVLRREWVLTFVTLLSVGVAYGLFHRGYSLLTAQASAMAVASVASVIVSVWIFRRGAKHHVQHEGRAIKARTSQLAYATSSYFFYGILYFVFIFADRLVAWSTNTVYLPYNIWFRGQYELGMDWSLAALFFPLSAAEVMIGYVLRWLEAAEHRIQEEDVARLHHQLTWVYWRSLAIFAVFAVVGVISAHIAVNLLTPIRLFRDAVPINGVEPFVFDWSSVAYVLLSVSLLNILFLFTLSHPRPALRVLLLATAIDVGVGIVVTRILGGYQFAVWGLMAGTIYLFVASTVAVVRMLPTIDYLLYRLA